MIKRINLDFTISSELYDLYIIDNSEWGISYELPAVIEITTPGRTEPVSLYFEKKEVTAYNSKDLKLNCFDNGCEKSELPDGIYHVKIKASPDSFFKEYDFLKTDVLDEKIKKAYVGISEYDCNSKCFKDLMQADFFLKTASSYILFGDVKNAMSYYGESKRIIDKLISCKTC